MKSKFLKILFIVIIGLTISQGVYGKNSWVLKPEDLSMPREKIFFDDAQMLLFNGRGFINPYQYSMTNFQNAKFYPIDLYNYSFHINFLDNKSDILIHDDVPALWDTWTREWTGTDPLGANFRGGFAKVMVTQDEVWQPNQYYRTGIFHKNFDGHWVSFGMKTWTSVSGSKDEVFLKIEITNRADEELDLTLIPEHSAKNLLIQGGKESDVPELKNPYTFASEQVVVRVSSNIKDRNKKGFNVKLAAHQKGTCYFAVQMVLASEKLPEIYQNNIADRMDNAYKHTCKRLADASAKMPSIKSDYKLMDEFYKRALLTMIECKYERDNFIVNPFWAVGTWPFTISWDNSFVSDALAMIDPDGLKEAILLDFREGKMKRTYIGYSGAHWDQIYIQEPFALQTMIEGYMRQTGDFSLLDAKAGDATVYEWMKRWVYELHDNYGNEEGLIDVGYSTEKIIEIRTDGYNHVVPIVNALSVKLFRKVAEWAEEKNDKDGGKFNKWADDLHKAINKKLWNEEKGWYDNLYPDGSKGTIWTYHLFDLLNSDVVSSHQYNRLISHIREGVFLGEFGFYSIARNDTLHWDRIDADWGGGGQYAGMPGRIARNLYETNNAELGWSVLNRYMKYINYFPYLSQNPRTDRPEQDLSSMPIQIASGAGMEAIIFGVFGIQPQMDGKVMIKPAYRSELGTAELKDFQFRGNSIDVTMYPDKFEVYVNDILIKSMLYGEQVTIDIENMK